MQKNKMAAAREYPVSNSIKRVFFIVFAVVFFVLFAQVLFNNMHFEYNPFWVLVCAAAWAALLWGVYRLTGRCSAFLEKREKWCLLGFALLLLATQFIFYWQVGAYPTMDFERVFTGAMNFTVNGFIEEPYPDYFYKYPNNMPLTILLQFIFRLFHRLGYSNFWVIGAVLAGGCIFVTYLFVYLCCKKLFGVRVGFFALGILYFCLPLQSYISIFYTDVVTLPFAPFAFYCYLRLRDAKTWKGTLAAAFVMALGLGFGAKIKYSVVLVLIAILADLLLRLEWKRILAVAGLFAVCFAATSAVFDSFMYANFLDEELAKDRKTPFMAWVMMGLARDGTHDADDNYIIWDKPTAEEKKQMAADETKRRLAGYTPVTFVQFLNQKSIRSFGSGNLDASRVVADSPMRQTFLVECVSKGGRYFTVYDTITQGYHVLLFLVIAAGAVLAAKRKQYAAFVPYLSIFGLWMFLLLWESGQRYLLNYYGLYIIAAAFAATQLETTRLFKKMREKVSFKKDKTKVKHPE